MSVKRVLRDLNKLNTFVRVAERKSFTRAAEDLRTTPSMISKHIKELEEALGFVILNRSTHGMSLTEAGEGLLQNCLEMLDQIDSYVTEARNSQETPHGTLSLQTIGDYAGLAAAPVVARYLSKMPGLKLHHSASPDVSQGPGDGADIILTLKRLTAPGFQEVDLGAVRHVVCASPAYLALHGPVSDPRMLKERSCIGDLKSPSKEWPFHSSGQTMLVEIGGPLLSNGWVLACEAAILGLGIVRAPARAVEAAVARGQLICLLENSVASPERLLAYHSGGSALPKKTAEFMALLREMVL